MHTPLKDCPFLLYADMSNVGLGDTLAQNTSKGECPILYLSHNLTKDKQNYAGIEREALAIRWAVTEFKFNLSGGPFIVISDHTPLQWLQGMNDTNPRLMCWYLALQPCCFTVKY